MVTSRNLNETGSVVLDGSGNGTVQITPIGPNEHWLPTTAAVKTTRPIVNEANCIIYIGQKVDDNNFVDQTLSGSSGDATGKVTGYDVSHRTDRYIFAVWSGGDAGARATLIVNGTKEIR
jgi:hypothetical protein